MSETLPMPSLDLPFTVEAVHLAGLELQTNEVRGYGGGQFELGPGRAQIQHLASLCYADAPNDVAPVEYHCFEAANPPPASPLPAFTDVHGFGGWTP